MGQEVEIADMVETIRRDIEAKHLPPVLSGFYRLSESSASKQELRKSFLQAVDGQLTEAETFLGMLSESLRDSVMTEFRDARGRRDRLAAEIHKWWDDNWIMPLKKREARARMKERFDLKRWNLDIKTDPDDIPEPVIQNFDRSVAMMIALHMGNPENEARLLDGYKWEKADVLRMLGDVLSKEELQFVQSTWDFFNKTLWPREKAKAERDSGLPLKQVIAAPVDITMADGSVVHLNGGYFPAKYNRDLATKASTLHATDSDLGYYYKSAYARQIPYTFKGHLKPRTPGYSDRLNLDFGILSSHLVQRVHDLAFDDFVKNTGKLFESRDFSNLAVTYLGQERVKALKDWLWGVANGYVDTVPESQRTWFKAWGGLRDRMVLTVLGHNVGVALGDLTNVMVSWASGRISTTSMLLSTQDAVSRFGHIDEWYEDLRAKSTVINTRSQHWVLELHKRMQDPLRRTTLLEQYAPSIAGSRAGDAYGRATDKVKETAFYMQEKIDKYSSIIIWTAAYRDADGKSEADRVKYADKMLEESLPHLEKLSQPLLLGKTGVMSSILLFHGYFNKLFNILRQDYRQKVYEPYLSMKAGETSGKDFGVSAAKYAGEMLAVFFISNVLAEYFSGRGKDDRETIGQYLTRKMVAAPFSVLPFMAPVGETVGAKIAGSRVLDRTREVVSFRQIPQLALLENLGRAANGAISEHKSIDKKVFDGLELFLAGQGLPARQWRRSSQYLYQTLISGERTVHDPVQFVGGLAYGERNRQPGNPASDLSRSFR
jgi:hypothetical protein